MPWTPEVIARETFYAHISSRTFPDAAVAKLKLGPLIASRTKSDIANSAIDCVYAQYIVSGFMKVVLPQCETILAAGDLMLHDGATPVRLQSNGVEYEVITCMIPKHQLACDDWLPSAILRQQTLISPIRSCLSHFATNLETASSTELLATLDAFVALVPAGTRTALGNSERMSKLAKSDQLRRILLFVHENLSDPELNPSTVAAEFRISNRYVHMLFAQMNTSFMVYVADRRLEKIKNDIQSQSLSAIPIATIANRWGYREWSTFFRAFKARHGTSPSNLRR